LQALNLRQQTLISRTRRPVTDAMKLGFYGVRTHRNWGFMAFGRARRTPIVMLMVPW
jgi:hypothetical protein